VVRFLARYGTILTIVVMSGLFAVFLPSFRTSFNLVNLLGQSAIPGLFSLALTCCLKVGDFDFSIGATGSLSGLVVASLLVHGAGVGWAVGLGLLVGITVGVIQGVLVGYLGFDSFICTIATSLLILGASMGLTKGQSITLMSETSGEFVWIGRGGLHGIPFRFIVMLGFAVLIWILHVYTETGRGMEAIAGNAGAARLYGIRVGLSRMFCFVLSGVCSATAGIIMTSSVMSARAADNIQYILGALAACFVGASTVRVGQFHVWGTILGVFMTVVATNGLIILMVPSYVTKVSSGAILLIAILLSGLARQTLRS
jgi:ribose transport system permease protein